MGSVEYRSVGRNGGVWVWGGVAECRAVGWSGGVGRWWSGGMASSKSSYIKTIYPYALDHTSSHIPTTTPQPETSPSLRILSLPSRLISFLA